MYVYGIPYFMLKWISNFMRSIRSPPVLTPPVQHEYDLQGILNDLARFKSEVRAELVDLRDIQNKFLEKFYKRFATRKWREEVESNKEQEQPRVHMFGGKSKYLLGGRR